MSFLLAGATSLPHNPWTFNSGNQQNVQRNQNQNPFTSQQPAQQPGQPKPVKQKHAAPIYPGMKYGDTVSAMNFMHKVADKLCKNIDHKSEYVDHTDEIEEDKKAMEEEIAELDPVNDAEEIENVRELYDTSLTPKRESHSEFEIDNITLVKHVDEDQEGRYDVYVEFDDGMVERSYGSSNINYSQTQNEVKFDTINSKDRTMWAYDEDGDGIVDPEEIHVNW